jgi:fructose-1,6-bisphosphatase/inositol monophosphatase family enzyme
MTWDRKKIVDLLLEGGEIAKEARRDLRFELKSDRSIVTRADREIEGLLSTRLERPGEGVYLIGEETVAEKGEPYIEEALAAECYVVDPIDGTAPYAHRLPHWGISVGRMEGGVLTDGAVYLPDFGEIVATDGESVLQGTLEGGQWEWEEVSLAPGSLDSYGLIAITQGLAKRGKVLLPNPVMVLGVAVIPLVGLLQRRFQAYLGSVKLWDIAGVLPLLLRKGFSVTVSPAGERREVTSRVEERTYHLEPRSPKRWMLRSDLLVCHPDDELRLRTSFVSGDIPVEGGRTG